MLYSYWEQNRAAGDLHVVYLISGLYQREGKAGNSHMMVVTLADEGEVDGRGHCTAAACMIINGYACSVHVTVLIGCEGKSLPIPSCFLLLLPFSSTLPPSHTLSKLLPLPQLPLCLSPAVPCPTADVAVKSKLAKISTIHVYSLQKAPLCDRSLLHSVDNKLTEQQLLEYPKWSSIKCTAVKRPPPNMEGTSLSVKPSENVQFSAKKPPKLSFMESKVASVLPREGSSAEREDRDSSASKKTLSGGSKGSKTKGKSGVAAMFNRMTDAEQKGKPALHVKEEKRKEEEEEGSVVASKGKRSPKKQHLNKVSAKELPGATSVEPLDTQEVMDGDSGKTGKKRTAQETSKDAKNAQKRRRVLVFSSDSEGEQHEEEEKPCKEDQSTVHSKTETIMEMPVSMTTSTTVKKQRKRVRRLKSRMFEDSDGSMGEQPCMWTLDYLCTRFRSIDILCCHSFIHNFLVSVHFPLCTSLLPPSLCSY